MDLRNLGTVLVPIDYSDSSLEALAVARDLVHGDAGRLSVVYVLPELHPLDPVVVPDLTDDVRVARAEVLLTARLADQGFVGLGGVAVRVGDPGRRIVDRAAEVGADLVVIASHGYTGFKHLLLGSVAERVVRRAPCPVLVLRRGEATR